MALPRVGVQITAETSKAEAGLERVEGGLLDVGAAADRAGSRTRAMGTQLNRTAGRSSAFTRGIQNASFQVGDFATQVGAGTSASVALGQQLPQLLGGFGVLGAVLGAVAAVAVPLTRAFQGLASSGADMSNIFGTLAPAAEGVASAFRTVRDIGVQMAEIIINNLDRILITAGAVAAFFAGRWVAAFVAARIATFSLVGALTALRTALIRTGIGALVVAAGELIYQFTRLVQAAGGFGEALALLKDLGVEAFTRIKEGFGIVPLAVRAGALRMKQYFVEQLSSMVAGFAEFTQSVAAGLNELFGTNLSGMSFGPSSELWQGMREGIVSVREEAALAAEQLGAAMDNVTRPLESLEAMREVLRSIRDERISLPDLLGGGSGDEDGGAGKAVEDINRQSKALQDLRSAGRSTYTALGNFIQQFAGKNKAAAVAAIAIQKGLSIAQIVANTAAAQMRALAELGPIAGPPVAAKFGLLGKVQAGLVAATGLAQAASAGGSGGSSSGGGGGGGGSFGGSSGGGGAPSLQASQAQRIDLFVQGEVFGRDTILQIIEGINEAAPDGAIVRMA